MEGIRFDDIETLRKKVSEEFGPWGESIDITQKMVDYFANVTGDHQWIHVDAARAKEESPFGTTIAHGFLILSLLPRMNLTSNFSRDYKIVGHGSVVNYGAEKLRFTSPVPVDCKIHGRVRVCAVERKPTGTQITQEIEVRVVGHERPALLYRMLLLYQGLER